MAHIEPSHQDSYCLQFYLDSDWDPYLEQYGSDQIQRCKSPFQILRDEKVNIFSYFSRKLYVMSTHKW